jgi:hypothetical protein
MAIVVFTKLPKNVNHLIGITRAQDVAFRKWTRESLKIANYLTTNNYKAYKRTVFFRTLRIFPVLNGHVSVELALVHNVSNNRLMNGRRNCQLDFQLCWIARQRLLAQ